MTKNTILKCWMLVLVSITFFHYLSKDFFFYKLTFIQRECKKLIKGDNKGMYYVTKDFCFK